MTLSNLAKPRGDGSHPDVTRVEADIEADVWKRFYWRDYHILRTHWTNFDQVAPGVFRSNQPDVRRFHAYAQAGLKSVINLRGEADAPFFEITRKSCDAFGLTLHSLPKLSATRAPSPEAALQVLEQFETAEKPMLIHCKSGADRTGLFCLFYLVDQCGKTVAEARSQLSFRYKHVKRSRSGVLDLMVEKFSEREGEMTLREWITTQYDPEALALEFKSRRK